MNLYRCSICGNVISLLSGDADHITCCGEKMQKLKANTVDASHEKHVPACTVKDDQIFVQVGETIHPMLEEHYIEWIALVKDDKIIRVNLKPGEEPKAVFPYEENAEIYEYCNLHGLWKTSI